MRYVSKARCDGQHFYHVSLFLCNKGEASSGVPKYTFHIILILPSCVLLFFFSQVFPDTGNNAVVISLQEGPVVNGDVKVMFESSAVSLHYFSIELTHICDEVSAERLNEGSLLLELPFSLSPGFAKGLRGLSFLFLV